MARTGSPITKTVAGTYKVRYRDDDGRQKAKTFDRWTDASSFLDTTRTNVRQGTYVSPKLGKESFSSFAARWAPAQDWKQTTRECWPSMHRRLDRFIGARALESFDLLALQQLRTDLGKVYKTRTVAQTMHYAGTILRSAYAAGLIARDPTAGLKAPKHRDGVTSHVSPEAVPTRAEVLALIAAAPDQFRAALVLGASGMRIGEVLGLTADRIDLERRRILIDRQAQRVDGEVRLVSPKREKVRTIVITPAAAAELRRHLDDHQGAGLLFRGERTSHPMRRDQFYKSGWTPAQTTAGLSRRFVFHSLRHFCASVLLAEGGPITAVAAHLGDTPETVMRTYAHWLRDDDEAMAELLARAFAVTSFTEPETNCAQIVHIGPSTESIAPGQRG